VTLFCSIRCPYWEGGVPNIDILYQDLLYISHDKISVRYARALSEGIEQGQYKMGQAKNSILR